MDAEKLAADVAYRVLLDVKTWAALIGLLGAIAGSILTMLGQFALQWYKDKPAKALDAERAKLLKQMLENGAHEWRTIETLSRVIGADYETTKRLLIGLGARGSEKEKDVWGLISRHPLSNTFGACNGTDVR